MSPHQRCDARGGDRKARFVQTAERHAGLSQFTAPFLSSRQPAGEVPAAAARQPQPPPKTSAQDNTGGKDGRTDG